MHKITLVLLSISFLISTARADVMFNLTDVGGAGVGTQARTGFQTAANYWSSVLTDAITVNLDIGFASLGANILGGASSVFYTTTFSNFHLAVQLDATRRTTPRFYPISRRVPRSTHTSTEHSTTRMVPGVRLRIWTMMAG